MKRKLDKQYTIAGKGNSLWGPSVGQFSVDSFIVNEIDYEEGKGVEPYELQLFGENTEWFHYTDSQIEREVNDQIVPLLKQQFPQHDIERVTWSEQGMQPDSGWSFDIFTKKQS